jgi:glycosyltransferase involved in cell wall biosynthesis
MKVEAAETERLATAPRRDGRSPLRVAVVDEELPYPLLSGKRIRTFNLLIRLARRHRITFICPRNAEPAEAREAEAAFRDRGIITVFAEQTTPRKSVLSRGAPFYTRLFLNLFSSLPYLVAVNTGKALRRAVETYAATHQVDLWQCEWTPFAEIMRGIPRPRLLIMAHNIESQIWQRYYQTETNWVKRWYIKHQWQKFVRFERRAFAEASRTVFVSAHDAALARSRYDAGQVDVVDNGVDTTFFRPSAEPRDRQRILFLGSLDWRPNLDAVQLLLDQIFPRVRAVEPSARLCIVGRNPPEWLRRRTSQEPGIELASNVPDVRPYLHSCGVMAVPLRIGGGSRLKILEALAAGLPVVSSTIGAEGLCLEDGRHLFITDDMEDLAQSLLQCMSTPELALAMARKGRELVLQKYDWDPLAERLGRIWEDCAFPEAPRAQSSE